MESIGTAIGESYKRFAQYIADGESQAKSLSTIKKLSLIKVLVVYMTDDELFDVYIPIYSFDGYETSFELASYSNNVSEYFTKIKNKLSKHESVSEVGDAK